MMQTLKIGEVARQSGVGVDTVRFYERRGVLPRAPRKASGYRTFAPTAVERIRFVRKLQSLGFTLDEIAAMLRAVDAGATDCARERPRFEVALARVDEQMAALRTLRRRLVQKLQQCRDGSCTLLEDLSATQGRPKTPTPPRRSRP